MKIVICSFIVVVFCFVVSWWFSNSQSLNGCSVPPGETHYWSGQNAPNGQYEVLFYSANYQTNIVYFPICPSSGSKLHGDWLFASGVVFPLEDRWIVVVLEGNVIVEAEWGIR